MSTTRPATARGRPGLERTPAGTRSLLMSAATSDFARRGFHGTSLRAVAKRAGRSLGCVRYHFGDKAGLYVAVLAEALGHVRAVVTPVPAGRDGLLRTLLGLTRAMSEPNTARLFLRAALDAPDTPGGEARALIDDLAKVIGRTRGERTGAASEPHVLAAACLCTVASAVLLPEKGVGLTSVDPDLLARYMLEFVRS